MLKTDIELEETKETKETKTIDISHPISYYQPFAQALDILRYSNDPDLMKKIPVFEAKGTVGVPTGRSFYHFFKKMRKERVQQSTDICRLQKEEIKVHDELKAGAEVIFHTKQKIKVLQKRKKEVAKQLKSAVTLVISTRNLFTKVFSDGLREKIVSDMKNDSSGDEFTLSDKRI